MFAEEMAPLQPRIWMAFPFGQDRRLQRMTKCWVGEEEAKTLQNSEALVSPSHPSAPPRPPGQEPLPASDHPDDQLKSIVMIH